MKSAEGVGAYTGNGNSYSASTGPGKLAVDVDRSTGQVVLTLAGETGTITLIFSPADALIAGGELAVKGSEGNHWAREAGRRIRL